MSKIFKERKAVQMQVIEKNGTFTIFALCDDGTIWFSNTDGEWERVDTDDMEISAW